MVLLWRILWLSICWDWHILHSVSCAGAQRCAGDSRNNNCSWEVLEREKNPGPCFVWSLPGNRTSLAYFSPILTYSMNLYIVFLLADFENLNRLISSYLRICLGWEVYFHFVSWIFFFLVCFFWSRKLTNFLREEPKIFIVWTYEKWGYLS